MLGPLYQQTFGQQSSDNQKSSNNQDYQPLYQETFGHITDDDNQIIQIEMEEANDDNMILDDSEEEQENQKLNQTKK